MKITIYTIPDCQFSKQEKDYLTANKLTFEEKNLEANREFLTEMMTLSNNFAGTPVTKVEKDDGQIAILKGFTKDEFDKNLGLAQPVMPVEPALSEMNAQVNVPQPKADQPMAETPVQQPTEPLPSDSSSVVPAKEEPVQEQPPVQPITPTEPVLPSTVTPPTDASVQQSDDQLKSVLADLAQKSTEPAAPQSPPATPPANLPNIPDFK